MTSPTPCNPLDARMMARAIELARQGLGLTAPNPPVGAVIVADGKIIGEGWHRRAGLPHAEREALADAIRRGNGDLLRGSTAYVTLEPCSTHGRTPPCCDGLAEAGVRRVVYGATDPNPAHAGRADAILAASGIEVVSGVSRQACEHLIRGFASAQLRNRPWVIAKVATSLDARFTRPPGESRWLSSAPALDWVQRLRFECDAILTTGATVRADDPQLTVRSIPLPEGKLQPWRVVCTRDPQSVPQASRILSDEFRDRTLVVPTPDAAAIASLFSRLARDYSVHRLMVEAGPRFIDLLLRNGLVDEWCQVITPRLCGGPDVLLPGAFLPSSLRLEDVAFESLDPDILVRGSVVS